MKDMKTLAAIAKIKYYLAAAVDELEKIEEDFDEKPAKEPKKESEETSKNNFDDLFKKYNGGSIEEVLANAVNLLVRAMNFDRKEDDE